ncbi:hypothetical protein [Leptolyngbya sp. FACHB-261]|uniref:hypothetical protein n=1 Tax=Leptolyngbya sp. FACHB-261 TaxID=2692806 RepID=UPI0016894A18|nr:hypothetical protein [Leptolyngbya sp. FACHB-261]MBD2101484.1 hypothetical protein [Leptolyngbya sp. FACHB-261]
MSLTRNSVSALVTALLLTLGANISGASTGLTGQSNFATSHPSATVDLDLGQIDGQLVAQAATTSLSSSGYLGGNQADKIRDVATAPDGSVYVVGFTQSTNFPNTLGRYSNSAGGETGFIAKFDSTGKRLLWSTYFVPNLVKLQTVSVDRSGSVYVGGSASGNITSLGGAGRKTRSGSGSEGFVAKLNPSNASVVWATLIGGGGTQVADMSVDPQGRAVVVGPSGAAGLIKPAYTSGRGFVARVNAAGTGLDFASRLGGASKPQARVATDSSGNIYVVGTDQVSSINQNGFILSLSASGSLRWRVTHGASPADERGLAVTVKNDVPWAVFSADGGSYDPKRLIASSGAYQNSYGMGGGPKISYIARLNASNGSIARATFLRATRTDKRTNSLVINDISIAGDGRVVVAGSAYATPPTSSTAPVRTYQGGGDAYVAVLSNDLSSVSYGTIMGSPAYDQISGLALSGDKAFLAGEVGSSPLRPVLNAFQGSDSASTDGLLGVLSF